ncbi:MAG: hypothetical protein AB9856_11400 [Cellulosilyticaceae bacterium]
MNKVEFSKARILILVFLVILVGGVIYGYQNNTDKNDKEARPQLPVEYQEDVISFVPYEQGKETMSLDEQISTVAKSSGAGIIVITTYQQKEEDLKDNFQEEVNSLIKQGKARKLEVEGHNRYILEGDETEYLYVK